MASRFQAAALVESPTYPNAIVWSEENLIAVASGHLVTILNAASPARPRGTITLAKEKPFPIGSVDKEELVSGCLLPICLSRDPHPSVRSVSWSSLGMATNSGCLLAVCTTEGRVKLYRQPFCDYTAEWIEVMDISKRLFEYLGSINYGELDIMPLFCNEQSMKHKCPGGPQKSNSRRLHKRKIVNITSGMGADIDSGSFMELEGETSAMSCNFQESDTDFNSQMINDVCTKSKDKRLKKSPENSTHLSITAHQYASRSALMSSLVIAWSPILQLSSETCAVPQHKIPTSFSLFAVGGKSGKIFIWRIHAPEEYSIEQSTVPPTATLVGFLSAHNSWITAINWVFLSSDNSQSHVLIASGSSDGSVKIWQACSDELLKSSESSHATFSLLKEVVTAGMVPVSTLSISIPVRFPHKMLMAVGKGSGSFDLCLCDTSRNKYDSVSSYEAHDRIVTGLAWAFDGCCLFSCGQDNVTRSWILLGNSLSEVPIPSNIPGLSCSTDLPHLFDSCLGMAVSPGSLAVAIVRSCDADQLNPMYEARSLKAVVEFFWLGGQQLEMLSDFSLRVCVGRTSGLPQNFAYWESNILWYLKQYENLNKPLVIWDMLAALLALKHTASEFVENLVVKWLSMSYLESCSPLPSESVLTEVSKHLGKASTRLLHLLNIICRRVMLSNLNADQISRKVQFSGLSSDDSKEEQSIWMKLLVDSERELRERLMGCLFSSFICSVTQSAESSSGLESRSSAGLAQMEQWIQLNVTHVHDNLKNLSCELRACVERLHSSEYVKKERCSYCSSSVRFESPEIAFCRGMKGKNGALQRHKLVRCAVSMCVCPTTPSWFCMCCQRQVCKMPPETLFRMCGFPLDFKSSTESFLPSKPLCPFCGIELQRLQPEFLLSVSPV